ncbi:MAG: Gfo/Idh/MocA family oxidoreductase [Chloroflexi bacterium]|nr:Gfo/Idh/MocA family oxidoreductase [Chloroflexota bacterium]MCY3938677.1 Gfo/Idh/MocA family oxidoreductase [Chloroflexota bacterium]
MPSQDLRIAVLHEADGYHAAAFCTIFNGGPRRHEFEDRDLPVIPPGARVTAVWDKNPAAAETLANTHKVDHVLSDLQDLPKFADAAVLTSGWDQYHHLIADDLIDLGVPFYVDKPLAPTLERATEIVNRAAERGVPMFSASAVRYGRELLEILPAIRDEGGIQYLVAASPMGTIVFYGVHAVELAVMTMGAGAKVSYAGDRDKAHQIMLDWDDSRTAVILVDHRVKKITLDIHTAESARQIEISDEWYYYTDLMKHFVDMALTGEPPFPPEETIEIFRCLDEARIASGTTGF